MSLPGVPTKRPGWVGLFSADPINRGRQLELDVARGLAVLFMVAIHGWLYFATPIFQTSPLGEVIAFFGGVPSAAVFMFLLGVGVVYSSQATPQKLAQRGLYILLASYGLNLLRGTLPALVAWRFLGDATARASIFEESFCIDILQFAGLALLWFAVIKSGQRPFTYAALSAVFFCLINFLLGARSTTSGLAAVTGLLWGSSSLSYFPFLTWIFYPLVGFLFGGCLIQCRDKSRFYLIMGLSAGLVGSLLYYVLALQLELDVGLESDIDYYHHGVWGNLLFSAWMIFWIAGLFFITRFLPRWVLGTLQRWSAHVAAIYFIHSILLGWLALAIDENSLATLGYLIFTGTLLAVSDLLAYYYHRHIARRAAGRLLPRSVQRG